MESKLITCLIIIIQIVVIPESTAKTQCNRKSEVQMDNALVKLLIVGQNNLKFPDRESKIRPYCNQILRLFDMIKHYSRDCLPDFGKESAKIIVHGIEHEIKSVCRSGRPSKRARELLKAAPCANAGLDRWQKCNVQIIDAFMGIPNADIKQRIPMACCNFHHFVKCMLEEAEEVKECTPKTIDYVVKYITKVIDPILSLLCRRFDESNAKCDEIVILTPKRNTTQKRYRSILIPVINVATSLGIDIDAIK